jgi:hypothetical protein
MKVTAGDDLVSCGQAILDALARIEGLLANGQPAADGDELLDRRAVAAWLGVSTRWVARHLSPTAQPQRGGRAWYRRSDVERQLEALRPSAVPPRAPKKKPLAKVRRAPHEGHTPREVSEIEARLLRAANGAREAPIRDRDKGTRASSRR